MKMIVLWDSALAQSVKVTGVYDDPKKKAVNARRLSKENDKGLQVNR